MRRELQGTLKLLVVSGLAVVLVGGRVAPLAASGAFSAHSSKQCCCGTADGRCCGTGCCSGNVPLPKPPVSAPRVDTDVAVLFAALDRLPIGSRSPERGLRGQQGMPVLLGATLQQISVRLNV
jgi:hypothetical protein